MHVFRPRTDLTQVLVALAPLVGAALIAISRLEDYRHDVFDVTVGSALGITMAYCSYRRYFPSLRSSKCGEAFPSRAAMALQSGVGKLRDEEQVHGSVNDELDDSDVESVPLNMMQG